MDDLIAEVMSPLCEGLIEAAIGTLCRVNAVRCLFGCGPYIEPEIQFSDGDLKQMRDWEELDAIQQKYGGKPTYISGFLSLGLTRAHE